MKYNEALLNAHDDLVISLTVHGTLWPSSKDSTDDLNTRAGALNMLEGDYYQTCGYSQCFKEILDVFVARAAREALETTGLRHAIGDREGIEEVFTDVCALAVALRSVIVDCFWSVPGSMPESDRTACARAFLAGNITSDLYDTLLDCITLTIENAGWYIGEEELDLLAEQLFVA